MDWEWWNNGAHCQKQWATKIDGHGSDARERQPDLASDSDGCDNAAHCVSNMDIVGRK
jgi:hypothetical protein